MTFSHLLPSRLVGNGWPRLGKEALAILQDEEGGQTGHHCLIVLILVADVGQLSWHFSCLSLSEPSRVHAGEKHHTDDRLMSAYYIAKCKVG